MSQLSLSLWKTVVFVDWHGTLSDARFWESILKNPKHVLYESLHFETGRLFQERRDLVRQWMRGGVESHEVVRELQVQLNKRYKSDFLLRRLFDDCRQMEIRPAFVEFLRRASEKAFVVIATDNMDCFFSEIRSREDVNAMVDDIICSSDINLLKSDNVSAFFGSWLAAHSLSFRDAILIDDCRRTCELFSKEGGLGVLYGNDTAQVLQNVIDLITQRESA